MAARCRLTGLGRGGASRVCADCGAGSLVHFGPAGGELAGDAVEVTAGDGDERGVDVLFYCAGKRSNVVAACGVRGVDDRRGVAEKRCAQFHDALGEGQ